MPNLISSLINHAGALNVHAKGAEIAGKNIANVNNPDFSRQRVEIMDLGRVASPDGSFQDLGVGVKNIVSVRDSILDKQIVRETSQTASLTLLQDKLSSLETVLGEQIDRASDASSSEETPANNSAPSGLSKSIDDFFNAFQEVAANPTDVSQKRVLLQRADSLVDKFQITDERLTRLDDDIVDEINATVIEVNGLLTEIASLNDQITTYEFRSPLDALELRNSRQQKLEELSSLMNFETNQLTTSSGHLQIIARDAANNDVILVDGPAVATTVSYDGTDFQAGAPAVNINVTGGALDGLQDMRSQYIPDLRAELDSLAAGMVSAINTAYNPLATVGEDFFDAANTTAGTISITPTITQYNLKTSNTGDSGANEIANAVADLANSDTVFTSGFTGSFNDYISQIASDVGSDLRSVSNDLQNQNLVERMLRADRDSIGGVSIDEEITSMLRYQRAFQASARVVNTIDEFLDVIVNGLKR